MESNELERSISGLTERWWTLVVRGVAAILLGVLAFAMPQASMRALVLLWGAFAVVDGVFTLVLGALRGRAGLRWGWWLFEGLVGVAAGVFTFVWPRITALVLVAVIATWAVLTGIAEIAAAIGLRRYIKGEWMLAASGVLSVVFGVLTLAYPRAGGLALVWLIGAYAIVFGLLLCALGFRLNRWRRTGEGPLPIGGTPTTA
jgi:uncharacterized membrane protein HdeD (DUF308 family)